MSDLGFDKQQFRELCQRTRDASEVTDAISLVLLLRTEINKKIGITDLVDLTNVGPMEYCEAEIIQIVEANSSERFDIRKVIREELLRDY